MRISTSSVRRTVALALIGGGLWVAPLWGQTPASTDRSVYDRRTPTKSSSSASGVQPRRLPATGQEGERPLAKPGRAKGYLSQDLTDARAVQRPTPSAADTRARAATRTLT